MWPLGGAWVPDAGISISTGAGWRAGTRWSKKDKAMREMFDPGMLNDAQESASGWAVAEAIVHVSGLAQSRSYAHGLKPSQWMALRYFKNAPLERRTVSAFAAFHSTTRGAASQMAEVLVGKELLVRIAVPEDRRVARLQLTAKAQELLKKDPLGEFAGMVERLPADDRRIMAASLFQLTQALWERR